MHSFNHNSRKLSVSVASSCLPGGVPQLRPGLDRAVGPTFTQLIAGAAKDDLTNSVLPFIPQPGKSLYSLREALLYICRHGIKDIIALFASINIYRVFF